MKKKTNYVNSSYLSGTEAWRWVKGKTKDREDAIWCSGKSLVDDVAMAFKCALCFALATAQAQITAWSIALLEYTALGNICKASSLVRSSLKIVKKKWMELLESTNDNWFFFKKEIVKNDF